MKNDDLRFVSLLGKGSSIRDGNLSVASHLKISGTVIQNIECAGKLVISGSGRVTGNIKARNMVIEGAFEGNAWVRNHITIRKSARVTGYLSAEKLQIEEGAHCQIDTNVDVHATDRFDQARLDTVPAPLSIPSADEEKTPAILNGSSGKQSPETRPVKKQSHSALSPDSLNDEIEIDRFW